MKIDILTIFPGMFGEVMGAGIVGRAADEGLIEVNVHDLRAYSADRHHRTDDEPFGGGAGMIMTVQPIASVLEDIAADGTGADSGRLVYMSPRGRPLDLGLAEALLEENRLVILCGRYEGVDQRVIDAFGFEEISIGDYVLTGGELPAMVLIDAVCRLIPGALGSDASHDVESVYSGLLEYPQYTRPAEVDVRGETLTVPEVLTSGHHRRIDLWQYEHSLELTKERRPDLFERYVREYGEGGRFASSLEPDKKDILFKIINSSEY
ncbi:MAG: tRNA (guanosine(37)-N1)-methyltransferase TrmD [Clostridiales Family XIII bacterium]|jgi:tRNA (guanine37-N1)-methyltransferase|nr:tRNA (guanosine(37)-N1)-methyltransferase TrmD [Clostridiales Family XIII bacterium]